MAEPPRPLSYADAGVDIDAGNALVRRIAPAAKATDRPGVMAGLGGFGGLFDPRAAGYADPVLVAATDGVGTKLRIAIDTGRVDTIGQDLVAMCVNDLVCQGAEPLFFLDYFATGRLSVDVAARVVEGIARACRDAGCALLGGETAEMPGMYADGDFDLAGFAVGAAERGRLLPRSTRPGDVLVALASSGVHSNGFSLVRRTVERAGIGWDDPCPFGPGTLADALLAPTRLYVRAVRAAVAAGEVRAVAHVTGGGITENLPRGLAPGTAARVELSARPLPGVFGWLIEAAGLDRAEALRTYNCGVGLVLAVAPADADAVLAAVREAGEDAWILGTVVEAEAPGVVYEGTWA